MGLSPSTWGLKPGAAWSRRRGEILTEASSFVENTFAKSHIHTSIKADKTFPSQT